MNWYVLRYNNKFIKQEGAEFKAVHSKEQASLFTLEQAIEMQSLVPVMNVRKFGKFPIEIEKFEEE